MGRQRIYATRGEANRIGGLARAQKLSPERRSEIAGIAGAAKKKPRKPVRKRRKGPPRRVSVIRDRPYMDWLKSKPCVISGQIPSDPAHTDKNNGGSSKGSDASCIPLARRYHIELDGHLNTKITTKEQFAEKYNLDLKAIAAAHYAEFKGTVAPDQRTVG